jgi:beta-galactosidase/beta-glucuronidase
MNNNKPPHLYILNVKLIYKPDNALFDEVNIRTGIRFIELIDKKLFINSRRTYLTGFGSFYKF